MEELNALNDFEKIIGKSIPLIRKEEIKDPWEESYQKLVNLGASVEFGAIIERGTITYLNLKESGLTFVPNSINKLKSLKSLNLSFNSIKKLPKEIGNLKELEELYIENIRTKLIPILARTSFSEQKYTEKICDYCLEFIPDTICDLKRLKKLILSGNNIETLPKSFGIMKNLEILRLNNNLIKELPVSFGDLENLKILDLGENKLNSLPYSIGNLENLEELILTHNQIKELPNSLGGLKKLKEFDLRDNKLNSLPSSFGKLKTLYFLDLGKNEFTSISSEIWSLDFLERLDLEDNPFEGESKKLLEEYSEREPYGGHNRFILRKNLTAIKDFCRKKAAISIFISHALEDFEKYKIKELSEFLEMQTKVYSAYYCEKDLIGNINDFMNQKIPECQLLIIIATKKSIFNSPDCCHELDLARQLKIPIIPIKGDDINWKDLDSLNLNCELGFEFRKFTLNELFTRIYEYIKNYKRDKDLFDH